MPPTLRQIYLAYTAGRQQEEEYIAQICSFLTHTPSQDDLNLVQSDDSFFALSIQRLIKSPAFEPISDVSRYVPAFQKCARNERSDTTVFSREYLGAEFLQPMACLAAQKGHAEILRLCIHDQVQFDSHLDRAALMGLVNAPIFDLLYDSDWRSIRSSTQALQKLATVCTSKPAEVLLRIYNSGACARAESLLNAILTNQPLSTIKVMLEQGGAKQRLKNSRALQIAARKGRTDVVELLLDAGADIDEIPPSMDFRESGPYQALFEAVKAGHVDVVGVLMRRGARSDVDNGDFYLVKNGTALDCAVREGNVEIVRLLERAD